MQNSKWRMFAKLYAKEMRELRTELLVFAAAVLLIDLFLYIRTGAPDANPIITPVVIIPTIMLLGIGGFIPLLVSIRLVWREWSNNTVYLIQSLPVGGSMVLGAKLLAVASQFIINTGVAGLAGGLLILSKLPSVAKERVIYLLTENIGAMIVSYGLIFAGFTYFICLIFLCLMIGKLSRRYSGLISFVAVLILNSLINNTMGQIIGQLAWENPFINMTPQARLQFIQANAPSYMLGGILLYLVVGALLFIAASVLYNRKIEV